VDFLYRIGRGELELYDPAKHGQWSIVEFADGRLSINGPDSSRDDSAGEGQQEVSGRQSDGLAAEDLSSGEEGSAFAQESHLRDFLAQNIEVLESNLTLFADDNGRSGMEYSTPIGRIDLLAVDEKEDFVVVELKVSRGSDVVVGQILRYMNWIRKNLASGRQVRGIIVAQEFDDRLRYAVMSDSSISLRKYRLRMEIEPIESIAGN
jgi:hypothetical protein